MTNLSQEIEQYFNPKLAEVVNVVPVDEVFDLQHLIQGNKNRIKELENRIKHGKLTEKQNDKALSEYMLELVMQKRLAHQNPQQSDSHDEQLEEDDDQYLKEAPVQDDQRPVDENMRLRDDKMLHDDIDGKPYPSKINEVHNPRRV